LIATFRHFDFTLEELRRKKREPITVVLPAREVADTVGPIVEALHSLDGLIDQVLVVDASSRDGTADVARAAGAEVYDEGALVPEYGPVFGKGDAMWRALAAVRGELVAYLDADTRDFSPHFALGMVGPLITRPEVQFVKGAFRRPFITGGVEVPDGGGRVTELAARPLLSAFYPELAGFAQPLAGEIAAHRKLLEQIPFATGYAIETAMLLDVYAEVGLKGMAQVDLEERRNYHQPLLQLGPMAYAVLRAVMERLRRDGRLHDWEAQPFRAADGRLIEVAWEVRPPFASVRTPA
jgi:glucosyl-3-phosphoglycerate synthase